MFSDKAVKIEESSLDHIFDSDEDDEGQEVRGGCVYMYVVKSHQIRAVVLLSIL